MQRRKFLAAAGTAIPLALTGAGDPFTPQVAGRQLIEIRTYEVRFGGSGQKVLLDYLQGALAPALKKSGCPQVRVMKQRGDEEPAKIWVVIAYPDAATYLACQDLSGDAVYQKAAADYNAVPATKPVYNRYTSQLLHSFTGMPEMADAGPDEGLYELRTYEGYSEDATRRKILMFNEEEITLFHKTGLHPVFFGEMISGPYRPSLVYMLHFKDMEERMANWGTFGSHPEWKVMSAKAEYADSVSNIRKTFLEPL